MIQIRAAQLESHLAKQFAPVYAIHGAEPLLVIEAADAVRAAARKRGYEEREVFFAAARGFDWSELRNAGASMSLFGGRKIIDLRLPTGKPGTEGAATIEAYCANPNPDSVLLVTLPEMDWKAKKAAWFNAFASAGALVEAPAVDRDRLPEWIGARLARNRQRAGREVLEYLADRVEGNLLAAHQEVQKLALLAPEGELTFEIVGTAVANVARYDVDGAGEALLAGDLARYARVLDGLRGEGEQPTYLLWVLSELVRLLLRLKDGLAASRPLDQLLRDNRVWGDREGPMRAALQRVSRAALRKALSRCTTIDKTIKGLSMGEPWDEFLKLGIELSDGRRQSHA